MIPKCLKFLTKHEKPNTHATKLAFLSRYLFGMHTDISGKCFKSLNSNAAFLNQNAFKPKCSLMLEMVKSCLVFKRISFQSFIWDILLSLKFSQNQGLRHQQQIRVRTITFACLEETMASDSIVFRLADWSLCIETMNHLRLGKECFYSQKKRKTVFFVVLCACQQAFVKRSLNTKTQH